MTRPLTARVVYHSEDRTHVAIYGDGPKPITVRTSVQSWPTWTCLTDHKTDCRHVPVAVAEFERFEASRKAQGEGDA